MSEETQVATETVVDNATSKPEMSTPDNSELIAESKKYRKRSQSAEARVAALETQINSFEDQRLKEKEDFKALYEKVSIENDQNKAKAKQWSEYETLKREELLSNIPEEERGDFEGVKLKSLENIISKMTSQKSANPDHVSNQTRNVNKIPKDWSNMKPEELRENWSAILENATQSSKN